MSPKKSYTYFILAIQTSSILEGVGPLERDLPRFYVKSLGLDFGRASWARLNVESHIGN